VFWSYFHDRDRLINSLHALLLGGWYTQNYVGKYLMSLLPVVADTPERVALIIEGLKSAVSNDARMIIRGMEKLPADWQQLISVGYDDDDEDDDLPF
jgi:hypothetical protein